MKGLHRIYIRDACNAQNNKNCPHGDLPFLIKIDYRLLCYLLIMAPIRSNSVINMKTSPGKNRRRLVFLICWPAQQTLARQSIYVARGALLHNPNWQDYRGNLTDNQAVCCENLCNKSVPRHHNQAELSDQNRAGLPHFLFLSLSSCRQMLSPASTNTT